MKVTGKQSLDFEATLGLGLGFRDAKSLAKRWESAYWRQHQPGPQHPTNYIPRKCCPVPALPQASPGFLSSEEGKAITIRYLETGIISISPLQGLRNNCSSLSLHRDKKQGSEKPTDPARSHSTAGPTNPAHSINAPIALFLLQRNVKGLIYNE